MKEFHKIIRDICDKHNIKYSFLSDDWIVMLEKNNITKFFVGYKMDFNGAGISNLLDDKYGLFEVLKTKHIPTIDHKILFKGYDRDLVTDYFNNCNKDLVVKENNGSCGTGVYHIKDLDEVFNTIDRLLISNYSVSICPFYDIKTEYRVINVDGNIELVYGKKRPIVIGDGKSTIIELLRKFNYQYFSKIEREDLNRILEIDEVFEYNWQFNLSQGSVPFIVEDKNVLNSLEDTAKKVINGININYCSIDIIELTTGEFLILECNSGIMMENYIKIMHNGRDKAYSIYEKAVLMLFNK